MIHGYTLKMTCGACPEQYDVSDSEDTQVAYLRLRHGSFTVEVPDVGGKLVYRACTNGDGIFEENERMFHLTKAIEAVQGYIANKFEID